MQTAKKHQINTRTEFFLTFFSVAALEISLFLMAILNKRNLG
jgi:hypothetical protein